MDSTWTPVPPRIAATAPSVNCDPVMVTRLSVALCPSDGPAVRARGAGVTVRQPTQVLAPRPGDVTETSRTPGRTVVHAERVTRMVPASTTWVETTTTPVPVTATTEVEWKFAPVSVTCRGVAPTPTVPGLTPVSTGAGTAPSKCRTTAVADVVATDAPTGSDSSRVKVSSGSAPTSGRTVTMTDRAVVPAGKLSVPDAGT